MITASLKNYRQSPRKVRSVAKLISGKNVDEAINTLRFLPKRATGALGDLVSSAVANAKNNFKISENLFIKEIRVDGGVTLKRSMPRSRGMANPINKRTSHVTIVLAQKVPKIKAKKTNKPVMVDKK